MEFLRERVYTSLNADELKQGDKVIVANTMANLREDVRKGINIDMLREVHGEDCLSRFIVKEGWFPLAYLVEREMNCTNCGEGRWDAEHKKILCDPINCGNGNVVFRNHEIEVCEYYKPIAKMPKTEQKAEKHYRPFRDTDELIKVWCEKGGKWQKRELTMPHIWVQRDCTTEKCLIVSYTNDSVYLGHRSISLHELWEHFTFIDGSPCGVEE